MAYWDMFSISCISLYFCKDTYNLEVILFVSNITTNAVSKFRVLLFLKDSENNVSQK